MVTVNGYGNWFNRVLHTTLLPELTTYHTQHNKPTVKTSLDAKTIITAGPYSLRISRNTHTFNCLKL